MKAVLGYGKEKIEIVRMTIFIGETEFRISEDNQGNLVINKFAIEDSGINVHPSCSNEIKIK